MSQAYTDAHHSIKAAITVYCRGCRFQGKGTHPFKSYAVPTKEDNTKLISSMGLIYHLKTNKIYNAGYYTKMKTYSINENKSLTTMHLF